MSVSAVRPKPWQTADQSTSSNIPGLADSQHVNTTDSSTSASSSSSSSSPFPAAPELPARSTALSSAAPTTPYGPYGGTSSFNSLGSYNGYGSYGGGMNSYNRMGGGIYGGGYGGYGGYNSGGLGGGYGGYGGYQQGMFNQDPNTMAGGLQNSTAATFQLIESIVGAVGGFAQMLESTYMATHSSFFAMVSVAEQFGHLKNSLGSILGIFAILRWSKKLIAKLTGKQSSEITAQDFAKFASNPKNSSNSPRSPRPSFKPLLFFFAAVFGFPFLLGKLIKAMASQQETRQLGGPSQNLDPSQLEFCRALYDFVPENPHVEIELRKGDLIAILSTLDMQGNSSQWWRARTRDGRIGYIPSTYVEKVPRMLPPPSDKIKPLVEEFNKDNA